MNEEAKKIIEKADQTTRLMQSTTEKLKVSNNPIKDGVKLLEKIGEIIDPTSIPLSDFYFIEKPLVVLRIYEKYCKLYDIEIVPKVGEIVSFSGKRCVVRAVVHELTGEGNNISHRIILSLENENP